MGDQKSPALSFFYIPFGSIYLYELLKKPPFALYGFKENPNFSHPLFIDRVLIRNEIVLRMQYDIGKGMMISSSERCLSAT